MLVVAYLEPGSQLMDLHDGFECTMWCECDVLDSLILISIVCLNPLAIG